MTLELKYGLVSDVRPGEAKVYFDAEGFPSDWLPVLVRKSKTDKESWPLEVNEHVICLMTDGCDEGVILGAISNAEDAPDSAEGAGKFRKRFADGTIIEYDKNEHLLTADVKGKLIAKTSGDIVVEAGTGLKATVEGNAEVEAASIKCKATISAEIESVLIKLTGNTKVTGSLEINGDLTANTVKAGLVDLAAHKHIGVQTGSGMTGPATP